MNLSANEIYEQQQINHYFPEIARLALVNRTKFKSIFVDQCDVILFDERLIHGGVPIKDTNCRCHALACHCIASESKIWDRDWPRSNFDGQKRIKYIIP